MKERGLKILVRASKGDILLFFILPLTIAVVSIALTRNDGGVAAVWVANAFIIAGLIGREKRKWTQAAVASGFAIWLANVLSGTSFLVAAGLAAANVVEALIVAWCLSWRCPSGPDLARLAHVCWFGAAAGAAGPAAGAVLGAAIVSATGETPFAEIWLTWFKADSLGNLTTVPLLMAAKRLVDGSASGRSPRPLPAITAVGLLLLTSMCIFWQQSYPLLFLLIPLAVLTSVTFGTSGAALSAWLVTVVGLLSLQLDVGPLAVLRDGSHSETHIFQLLLASILFTCLPLAAVIAERDALYERLADSERRHRTVIETVRDVVYETDDQGRWRALNPAWETLSGETPEQSLGRSFLSYVHLEDRAALLERLRKLGTAGDEDRPVVRCVTRSGIRHLEILVQPIRTDNGLSGVRGTMRDVTDQILLSEELGRAAATDSLTGIPNRAFFLSTISSAMARTDRSQRPTMVALMDIDHFKRVNDTYGHMVGDEVLRRVAGQLQTSLRQGDVCARLGGEEFVAIFEGIEESEAALVCERLRNAIAGYKGRRPSVTVSIGLARWNRGETIEVVLTRADRALYEAKNNGRDQIRLAA